MESTGVEYPTTPPQYEHKCPVCGNRKTYDSVYPRTEYISCSEFQQVIKENPLTATNVFKNDIQKETAAYKAAHKNKMVNGVTVDSL